MLLSMTDVVERGYVNPSEHEGLMLLDEEYRIRDVNPAFEQLAMRGRDELIGGMICEVFPDNPDDADANGSSMLAATLEFAARSGATHTMPIVRYDVADPTRAGTYSPKLWTCSNTALRNETRHVVLLQRVSPIVAFDQAIAALRGALAGDSYLGAAEQIHVLDALALSARDERD